MPDYSDFTQKLTGEAGPLAANATGTSNIGECPFAGRVTSVTYTPDSTITGADTNTRTLTLVNKGAAGAGSTVIATLALTNGVNATGSDEKALTLTVTTADRVVAEGDILAFVSTHAGTGLADPGGLVQVELQRALG